MISLVPWTRPVNLGLGFIASFTSLVLMVSEGVTAKTASHIPAPSPANNDLGPVSFPFNQKCKSIINIQPEKTMEPNDGGWNQ
jgi:hypothetical protein